MLGGRSVWCPQCGTPNDVPIVERSGSVEATVETTHRGEIVPVDFSEFLAPPVESSELGRLGGYRVLRPIGVGGMGIVFEAEDPILKRLIAMKVMRPDVARSGIARKRFLREAEAAAQLKHDHILPIYHVGEDRDVLYLTMPLLLGETLDARSKREQRLQISEVVAIGKQVASGLAAAHAKGLVHRDIKPGNIWLEASTQRAIVLDFGLARQTSLEADVTGSGVIVGSPAFMSPEQANGLAVGPAADLFSLGCVLYLIATGQRPFQGVEVMSVLMSLANETPIAPHELRPEIPEALSRLIMKLLEKSPRNRPASADEVVQILGEINPSIAQGIPVDPSVRAAPSPSDIQTRPTQIDQSKPPPRREPRRRWGIISASVAVLALIALAIWYETRPGPARTTVQEPPKEKERPQVSINADHWNREVAERILEAGGIIQFQFPGEDKTTEMKEVRRLPSIPFRVQMITLEKLQNANELMDSIHDLEKLSVLAVKSCPLDDAGLAKLKNLPGLEWLIIKDARLTGAGLAVLHDLPNCRYVDIVDAPISDQGLSHLQQIPKLDRLVLQGTKITGPGLKYLVKAPNIQRLDLSKSPVNDAGLAQLPSLPKLTDLSLNETYIGDAGLLAMKRQPGLKHLYLLGAKVTQQGVDEFRKKFGMDCEIVLGAKQKSK
jgi:serine/threonine protein kinase